MPKPKYRVIRAESFGHVVYKVQKRFLLWWFDDGHHADYNNFENATSSATKLQELYDLKKDRSAVWYPPTVDYKKKITSHGGLTVVSGETERDGGGTR